MDFVQPLRLLLSQNFPRGYNATLFHLRLGISLLGSFSLVRLQTSYFPRVDACWSNSRLVSTLLSQIIILTLKAAQSWRRACVEDKTCRVLKVINALGRLPTYGLFNYDLRLLFLVASCFKASPTSCEEEGDNTWNKTWLMITDTPSSRECSGISGSF